jgi:dihydrodipicolinate synthase/N-acetylneuraminate lyase
MTQFEVLKARLHAVQANARWLPDAGIDAVAAPSGTGELFSLSPQECLEVVKTAMGLLGHPAGLARPPLGNLNQAERTELSTRAALSAIA